MAVQLRQVNGEAVGGALSIAMAMLRTHFVIDWMMGYVSIYLFIYLYISYIYIYIYHIISYTYIYISYKYIIYIYI